MNPYARSNFCYASWCLVTPFNLDESWAPFYWSRAICLLYTLQYLINCRSCTLQYLCSMHERRGPSVVFEFFRAFYFAILTIRPFLTDNIVKKVWTNSLYPSPSRVNISFALIQFITVWISILMNQPERKRYHCFDHFTEDHKVVNCVRGTAGKIFSVPANSKKSLSFGLFFCKRVP